MFLPDDILLELLKYFNCNIHVINLLKTCKYIKNLYYKHGYIKNISIEPLINNDIYNFSIVSCKHHNTLNLVSIRGFNNPQHWIFIWPKNVFIIGCRITDKIKPSRMVKTEYLYLLDDRNHDKNKKIFIDWTKFPNLKEFHTSYLNFNNDINNNVKISL